jgi:predicted NBD/HSP70 family sugar kinase
MAVQSAPAALAVPHGAMVLPGVEIDSYNIELRDGDGFVGDRASKGAFFSLIDGWRARMRKSGPDPLGEVPSEKLGKQELDSILAEGDAKAAGVIHTAVEEFAQELAGVILQFSRLEEWKGTQRIVLGGGLRNSRVGEIVIGRAEVILQGDGSKIELAMIRNHPDEAGLIGAIHLAPPWVFAGFDGLLAIDIGGTNIRAGIVKADVKRPEDLAKAKVWKSEVWRHADERRGRDNAVEYVIGMIEKLIARAGKAKVNLAPFIGIGCPGRIAEDGSIEQGAQNLPGNWESARFNLPARVGEAIPQIGTHDTTIIMHNDAVVQGLSELPFMQDVERWAILTIGTGLGNARFTNRRAATG